MGKHLILLIATTTGFWSCSQSDKPSTEKIAIDAETLDSMTVQLHRETSPATKEERQFIDTEYNYADSAGENIIIQNSFPKGGGDIDGKKGYTDSAGQNYAYAILWTRVINETDDPVELTISFPGALPSPYTYLKLFLPSDTMTPDKESLYNYGITGLKSFLDAHFNKSTTLKKTIGPNREYIFYITLLSNQAVGTVRAGLVLKDQNLFYKVSILPGLDSALIPCGQIVFEN